MARKPENWIARMIVKAIHEDGRTLYGIAKAAGLKYQTLHRIATERRADFKVSVASALCKALDLELCRKAGG